MGDTFKDMTAKFGKLDKFKGNGFRRWQKKMHFFLTTLKVVYVLSTPMPEFVEDEPQEQTRKQCNENEEEESTPQPKSQASTPIKETLIPKPYKPKIPYPQHLRKEKMVAQYGMSNYGKFLKELVSNKHKLKQISSAFLSNESSAMIQNKVPPKLEDPESFLIPCTFSKTFSCNALADLGASINLIPYSLYAKLSLKTLKPTKISVRLANRSFQHPIGIAENMIVEVGILFLYTADAIIQVKQKQLNLGVDEILEEDFDALLDEGSEILHSIEGTILEEKLFAEFDEFMAMDIE
ncbi:reverse transcriptase domain-containing protein [Tanacetum coccineum]